MTIGYGRHPTLQVMRTMAELDAERQEAKLSSKAAQRESVRFVFDTGSLLNLRTGLEVVEASKDDLKQILTYLAGRAVITPSVRDEYARVSRHRNVPRDIVRASWKIPTHDPQRAVQTFRRNTPMSKVGNSAVDKQLVALARISGLIPITDDTTAAELCWEYASVRAISTREFVAAFNAATGSSTKMAEVGEHLSLSATNAADKRTEQFVALDWENLIAKLGPPPRLQLEAAAPDSHSL